MKLLNPLVLNLTDLIAEGLGFKGAVVLFTLESRFLQKEDMLMNGASLRLNKACDACSWATRMGGNVRMLFAQKP